MRAPTAFRAAALAAVALVAAAAALALSGRGSRTTSTLPPPAGPWYTVLAAPYTPKPGKRSACNVVITRATEPISHHIAPGSVLRLDAPRAKPVAKTGNERKGQ